MPEQILQDELDSAVRNRIRRQAYRLYEQRGRGDGFDVQDWLNAEREIVSRIKSGEAMSLDPQERRARQQAERVRPTDSSRNRKH
jgi:hypothetical protein